MDEDKRRALDETRRCLYIALQYAKDGEPIPRDLRGTIVNALKHHHRELNLCVSVPAPSAPQEIVRAIDAITAVLGD